MKIVFVMRTPFFLKNFAAGIRELMQRGHEVQVLFSEPLQGRVGEHLVSESADILPGVSMMAMPPSTGVRGNLTTLLSTLLDVLRYDHTEYDDAPKLRKRANNKQDRRLLVRPMLAIARKASAYFGSSRVEGFLRRWLDHVPAPAPLVNWLRQQSADLLLVSPLTPIGSEQAVWILAARQAGVRVGYCMYSWDNLSNKGLLRPEPDAALVWNNTHRDEAVHMHGMPAEAVHYTGSPGYDIWFESDTSEAYATFCQRVGLDSKRPYLLYTCSSVFVGGKQELPFVEGLLSALRNHEDPDVAGIGVLIRPHPQFSAIWEAADFSKFGNVVVYPRKGAIPFSGDARTDYQNSIRHSLAVVGINTSAMVEAAIIDRPVMTIADGSYSDTQAGTLHFRHLQRYGFLIHSESITEFLNKLDRLHQEDAELITQSHEGNRRFVSDYIRPRGIEQPAAKFWADAVEAVFVGRKLQPLIRPSFLLLTYCGLFVTSIVGMIERLYLKKPSKNLSKTKSGKSVSQTSLVARSKSKIRDYLNNEPPRVKDLAVQSGPYPILKKIEASFVLTSTPPRVLVLGDSVHYRVSRDDVDRRTLAEMLAEQSLTSGFDTLCVNYSAYHPSVYTAILRTLARMPQKPHTVVLPINLRCFSPQWHLHPDHAFAEEMSILDGYHPGYPIAEVLREKDPSLVEAYDATEVCFSDSHLTTIGQFRLVAKAESRSAYQEAWRARQIAIFHYLYPLTSDHPLLMDAVAMVRAAVAAGIRPVVYLTPINHMHGIRAVGERFTQGVSANVELLTSILMPEIVAAQGSYYDWSRDFSDTMFFHLGERTEHLNETGRVELVRRIVQAVGTVS